MAAGPLPARSPYPATSDNVFRTIIDPGSGTWRQEYMYGVKASLAADSILRLLWDLPWVNLPSGVLKLRCLMRANAVVGNAKINAKWNCCPVGTDPSTLTLNAEGVDTVTWGTGDNWKYKELKKTLDASTAVASQVLVMDLTFETSGWTLAAILGIVPQLIWEP